MKIVTELEREEIVYVGFDVNLVKFIFIMRFKKIELLYL